MKIQPKLAQTQTQQQQIVMTPKLHQAIKVLMMPQLELKQFIQQELEQNPLLEIADEYETALAMEDYDPSPDWNKPEEDIGKEDTSVDIDWDFVFNDMIKHVEHNQNNYQDPDEIEPDVPEIHTLQQFLLDQLHFSKFNDVERKIGELIIGNLNEDGQLRLKLFSLPSEHITEFENGILSQELQLKIEKKIRALSKNNNIYHFNDEEDIFEVKPIVSDIYTQKSWKLIELSGQRSYTVKHERNELNLYELTLEDIASEVGCSLLEVEKVLSIIQNSFEPTGIAYRDLKETLCLQIQHHHMQHHSNNGSHPNENEVPFQLAETIIKNHLPDLLNQRFVAISESLNLKKEEIIKAANWISTLSPYPGRYFADPSLKNLANSPGTIQGIIPDVQIHKINDEYVIMPLDNYVPRLRINPYYINLLRDENRNIDNETKKWIEKKYSDASDILNCIAQRGRTIERVTAAIFEIQSDFLEDGPQSLKPLTLKTIAEMAGVHESTVSRVTSNKNVQTPIGTYPLKFFFRNQLGTTHGDSVSSEKVKTELIELISKEDSIKPLSDQAISTELKNRGIIIARRTVQKYREELGILSSRQRKNQ